MPLPLVKSRLGRSGLRSISSRAALGSLDDSKRNANPFPKLWPALDWVTSRHSDDTTCRNHRPAE
ncbi:hypothetical protein CP556_22785 [Natrinema sp. CBA1119]|nr:hypothetical protein CP556_22785 [Natrinema sp. CBA1119]